MYSILHFSVSPLWKSLLSNLAAVNRGILFLHDCDVHYGKKYLSVLTEGSLKHLVFRGTSAHVESLLEELTEFCRMIPATTVATLSLYNVRWDYDALQDMISTSNIRDSLFTETNLA